jgi:hypothetical protein
MLFWFSCLKKEKRTGNSGLEALKVLTGSVRPWISVSRANPHNGHHHRSEADPPRLVRTARRNAGLQMK